MGIGGIGMSAVARYFHALGKTVSGYHRTATELTRALEASGISISYTDDGNVPHDVDLVVYTPAIPKDNKGLLYYQDHKYKIVKRSDILQLITESSFNICIAGTHGKTTTTTMVAHILRDSGYGCNAFLGGIAANYGTNFWSSERNVCVIEADEYDRSFLKLSPDIAVITSTDADHLDIYGTAENVKQAFADFAARIKPGGLLLKKFALGSEIKSAGMLTYSLQNESADVYAKDIQLKDGGYVFTAVLKDKNIEQVHLNMGGMHNVENNIWQLLQWQTL
ncbi:MAG: Mur ligase family protein [Propionicimonas sp.]